MTQPIEQLGDLIACPCDQHGRLRADGADYVSECCNQRFQVKSGVLVLLPKG